MLDSDHSDDCRNSHFISSCQNCESCFLCVNQVGKKYYIRNEQYTKEQYEKEVQKILKEKSRNELKQELETIEFEEANNNKPETSAKDSIEVEITAANKNLEKALEYYENCNNSTQCEDLRLELQGLSYSEKFSSETSSKISSPVAEARSDHLLCVSGVENPSIPRSTINP